MAETESPRIYLASGSPRRRLLFQLLGIPHELVSPDIDERSIQARTPREFALKAAFAKANAADALVPKNSVVVSADTIVVVDEKILFKPVDEEDAFKILRTIAGRTHHVISSVAVREVGRATQLDAVTTEVTMRNISDEEIREYIATGEPMDKAGAYGIQAMGGRLVERITGDYFNVVGLPLDKLLQMLSSHVDVGLFQRARRELTPEKFAAFT